MKYWISIVTLALLMSSASVFAQSDGARPGSVTGGGQGGTGTLGAPFDEGFEDLATLLGGGWESINTSDDVGGATNGTWFQGNDAVFPAHEGPTTSYAAANFNATGGTAISLWLLVPDMGYMQSASFFTRTVTGNTFADNMQVRFSSVGGSNVGTDPATVGDYTNLLLDIDPALALNYPETWTQFTVNPFSPGRLAFRYFVPTSAGPTGANSNYIGVDSLDFVLGAPVVERVPVLGLSGLVLLSGVLGLAGLLAVRARA